MKIRIIGPCGSGKSFISREIATLIGIKNYELDNFVWDRNEANKRYSEEIRDEKLSDIVNQESWIIEGVHYKWALDSFRQADYIFILSPPVIIRDYRVIKRFIRTRIGLEEWNYKQSFSNLIQMFKWNRKFDLVHTKNIMNMTDQYAYKRYIVRSNKEIKNYLQEHLRELKH
jgi:adenylate kinase family enzyme